MTSPTKQRIYTQADTQRLLAWIKASQPRVYTGLVRRFTPADRAQVAGIWDSITGAVSSIGNSVTNFLNSEGAGKLLTAAQPFLQTTLEKEQLKLNLQRMQSGLPIQYYPPASPGATSVLPYGTDPMLYQQPPKEIPWGLIGGGLLATVLLLRR
jgi:hypothetical protein